MASWVVHLVIPGLVALAFWPQPRRVILGLALLSLLPDADWLVPVLHRGPTHSLLVPMWLGAIAIAVARTRRESPWSLRGRVGTWWLAAYYWTSHILLDILHGGTQALWPISKDAYFLWVALWVETATNRPYWDIEWGIVRDGVPTVSERYPWIGYTDAAILLFLGLSAAVMAATALRRRATPSPTAAGEPPSSPEPDQKE